MQDFISKFSELFIEPVDVEINEDTDFKEIKGWDSLVALSLIVMVSDNYGKSIDGQLIKQSRTLRNLYDAIFK